MAKIIGKINHDIREKIIKIRKTFYYKDKALVNEYGSVYGTETLIVSDDFYDAKVSLGYDPGYHGDVWSQEVWVNMGKIKKGDASLLKKGWSKGFYYIYS